jgi:hypothetical protein
METKDRLLAFIAYKQISKRKFCLACSLSHTIFNMNKSIVSDKLERIYKAYPELNMDWVITGQGEMIRNEQAPKTENKETNEQPKKETSIYVEGSEEISIVEQDSFNDSLVIYRKQIKLQEEIIDLQRKLLDEYEKYKQQVDAQKNRKDTVESVTENVTKNIT